MYEHMYVWIYVCMYEYMCIMYVYINICTYAYIPTTAKVSLSRTQAQYGANWGMENTSLVVLLSLSPGVTTS